MTHIASALEMLESRRHFAFGDFDPAFANGSLAGDEEFSHGAGVAVLANGGIAVGRGYGSATAASSQIAFYNSSGVRTTLVDHVPFNTKNILKAVGTGVFAFTTTGLTKYTSAGIVDSGFGTQGSVAIAGDYNSVEVGYDDSFNLVATNSVSHYRADGSLDTSYGRRGRLRYSGRPTVAGVAAMVETVNSVAVLKGGGLLVAGVQTKGVSYRSGSTGRIGIATNSASIFVQRYDAKGRLDTAFGDGGVYQLRLAKPTDVVATTVQILSRSNGTAVLGYTSAGRVTAIALDAAGHGRGPAVAGPASGSLSALYRQPDGGVLAVSDGLVLQKLTLANGRWQAGPRVTGEGTDLSIADTTVDAQGRLVATGTVGGYDYNGNLILGRYDTASAIDPIQLGHFAGVNTFSLSSESDNVGLAYLDPKTNQIAVAMRDGVGRWEAGPLVDTTRFPRGTQLSLKLTGLRVNGTQRAGIAYYDPATGNLKYAYSFGINDGGNGQSFGSQTVDSAGDVGVSPSLLMTPGGLAVIAYYDRTNADLKVAFEGSDGTWSIHTIDAAGDTGRSPSLAYNDNTGRFAIAYAGPDNTVKFAEQNGASWRTYTVATTAGGVGGVGGISLNFERLGPTYPLTPRAAVIAYYETDRADLVVARRVSGRVLFSNTTVASRGARGLYPNVVQSQSVTNGYAEAVYWDRTHNAVRYGFDARFNTTTGVRTGGAFESNVTLAANGGQGLSAVFADESTTNPTGLVLAYLDSLSGDVIVRDASAA